MRTPRLFLGIFALALLLPLLLLACGGSDEPTDGPSSERATAEPTDLPDSERATDEPETPASPTRTAYHIQGQGTTPTAEPIAPSPGLRQPGPLWRSHRLSARWTGKRWLPSTTQRTVRTGTVSENWLSDAPLGLWAGVTTNDDGRVTELALDAKQLDRKAASRSWAASPDLTCLVPLRQLLERGDTCRSWAASPTLAIWNSTETS